MALKKSERLSLEEATRLAILGKLPLKESKDVKTESTTVTTDENLTMVETDDANIVIEPKSNASVDVGNPVDDVCVGDECTDLPAEVPTEEPVEDIPVDDAPVDNTETDVEETEVDEFEESKKFESKKIKKEHKVAVRENRVRSKKVETVVANELTYIDDINDLRQFCWGDAAKSTLDIVEEHGKEDDLMGYLEGFGYDEDNPIGATELNDIIAYDDYLLDEIGINLDESRKVENKTVKTEGEAPLYKKRINKVDIKKQENKEIKTEGEAPLFKKRINKVDIKKQENKEVKTEGEAPLYKKRINKVDIKKVEGKNAKREVVSRHDIKKTENRKVVTEKEGKEPKRHVINKVDLRKTEAKKKEDLNDKLKTRVAEGLTKFVKEAYTNGKEVKVEKVLRLTENKLFVKGTLVMEKATRDFTCKLVPMQENKTFRKYTINENKTLKITEGKTSKGKSFSLIIRK